MSKEEIIARIEHTINIKQQYLDEIADSNDVAHLSVKALMPLWLADLKGILRDVKQLPS